jgi:hypothetical protein
MTNQVKATQLIQNALFVSIITFLLGVIFLLLSYINREANPPTLLSDILRDLGIVLCSIGLISLLYEMLIRRQLLTDYNNVLQQLLDPDTKKLGIQALFRDREDKTSRGRSLDALLRNARKEIFCIGLGFYQFLPEKRDLILARIREGCSFRFLMFNPNSEHAAALDESLGYGTDSLINFLRAQQNYFIEFAKSLNEQQLGGRLQVKTYDLVPTFGAIAVDPNESGGCLIVEFYGAAVEGSVCPGVEIIGKSGAWHDFYNRQMEELWRKGGGLVAPSSTARPENASLAKGSPPNPSEPASPAKEVR